MARQQARRRHRERIAGVVVAGLGVAVLVVAGIALREPNGHSSSANAQKSASSVARNTTTTTGTHAANAKHPAGHSSSSSRTTDSQSSAKDVPLVVLNNTTIGGLAAQAATRFERGGWTVTSHGNLTNDIASTCAYYDPSVAGARTAAEALQAQYPTIKRVKPKFPELPSGPVVVVLTPDYSPA